MKLKRRAVCASLIVICLGTVVGCPPPWVEIPECTDEDLQDLRFVDSVVVGDAGRIVFERAAFVRNFCYPPRDRSIKPPPRDLTLVPPPPYWRVWVRLDPAELAVTTIAPPLPGPVDDIRTDGHWAAVTDRRADVIRLRDLDSGTERVIVEGITTPYRWVDAVARPYVLLYNLDSSVSTLLNAESGESLDIPYTYSTALSPPFLAYSEFRDTGRFSDLSQRLKLRNLETGQETVIADPVGDITQMKPFEDRLVWVEYFDGFRGERVLVHDRQTGVTSTLTEIDSSSNNYLDSAQIDDIGEAGVVIRRGHFDFSSPDPGLETIDLLTYAGQNRRIESHELTMGFGLIPQATAIGPYIVYQKDDVWVIYNTDDDMRREVDPFAQLPPGSQPGP